MVKHVIAILGIFVASAAAAQDYVPGEVLVKMKGRASGSKSAAFMGKVSSKLALKTTYGRLNIHHMSLKSGQDLQKVLAELRENPDVEFAEPNFVLRKVQEAPGPGNRVYSVEEAGQVAAQSAPGESYHQSYADTKVTETWAQLNAGSDDVIVAVIDTGVDYAHEVFTETNSIWRNPGEIAGNGVDDDGNGFIDDIRGWNFQGRNNNPMDDDDHGTHVAGIVVGVGQDIILGPRENSKIKIMPLKFLGADGSGSTSDAISAIYYAANNQAQVINNSWGGGSYSQSLHDALAYAYSQGVVLVAAAGNSKSNNDSSPLYPANYPVPSQISVAATNDWDVLASFSNYGASTVHMAAPGVGIYSTVPGNYFRYMSGTSMAAPFVAGLAALAIREAPHLSGYQIRNLVINASSPIAALAPRTASGSRANSLSTVVSAKGQGAVSAEQPGYVASAPAGYRAPGSVEAAGGCGLVSTAVMRQSFGKGGGTKGGGSSGSPLGLIVALTLLPVLAWQVIRMHALANPKNRRRFERFVMNSEVKVRVGDRELVGQMNTISMGGVSFKADALLEQGGVVTLQIASPDGQQQVQVEGRIVWSEQNQAYGVQFGENKASALDSIKDWTKGLAKAS
ncbi:MAG: S8 family serine peptidase [Bdellovibrio sp.]